MWAEILAVLFFAVYRLCLELSLAYSSVTKYSSLYVTHDFKYMEKGLISQLWMLCLPLSEDEAVQGTSEIFQIY